MLGEREIQKRLEKIGHTFVVLSGKGGVGKSTVAVNLALSLAASGIRTGLLDVDIHGPSIPKLLNLTGKWPEVKNEQILPIECYGGLKVMSMGFLLNETKQAVIWRGPMKANLIREFVKGVDWGDLDYLVIDCPPGTGDEPLSVAQLFNKRSNAIIVTTPQKVATVDVEKSIAFCKHVKLAIAGVIENMSGFSCPHCGKEVDIFSTGGGEQLAAKFGIPFLGRIPLDPEIAKSGDEEQPYVYLYSKTETSMRFVTIVDKITKSRGMNLAKGHIHNI